MNAAGLQWLAIIRFELAFQLRRKSTWFFFGLFLLPLFGVTGDGLRTAATRALHFNAPVALAQVSVIFTVVAMLWLAAVAGDAATRDVQTGMEPLVRAAPISPAQYIGGRFLGAFAVAAILLAVIPLVQMGAGLLHPGAEAAALGRFRPGAHLQSYFLLIVPNAFVMTAILFALASVLRHTVGSYIGAAGVVVAMQACLYLSTMLGGWRWAPMLDPTGVAAIEVMKRTWPPIALNENAAALTGTVLLNRLLWLTIASALLVLVTKRYQAGGKAGSASWWQRGFLASARPSGSPLPGAVAEAASRAVFSHSAPVDVPVAGRDFGVAARVHQALAIARDSLREIGAWGWLLVPLLAFRTVIDRGMITAMGAGTMILPVTDRILGPLEDAPPPIVLLIIMFPVLLAGELIWRERDAHMQGLADTTPVPDGIRFIGKLLGLWFVIIVIHAMLMVAGMLAQASLGWYDFQPALYLKLLFGFELVGPLLFAAFALSIHVLANQKHVGHLLVLALIIAPMTMAETFGLEHPLLLLGKVPSWRYSAISGFGPYVGAVLAFHLYWGAWTLLLALVARLFWVRGIERGPRERVRLAWARFTPRRVGAAAGALGLVLIFGGFIFYNTNVLNEYRGSADRTRRTAEYEQKYGRFRSVPVPDLASTVLDVELYPDRREAEVRGVHHVVNTTRQPIDTIHLAIASGVETSAIEFSRSAHAAILDDDLGHRVYVLDLPLQPGDSLSMTWRVRHAPRGFPAGDISAAIVANGSFIEMSDWIPRVGYQPGREFTDAGQRKTYGLPARPAVPSLSDVEARKDATGRDLVSLDVTVGTTAGQAAVAPGELRRTWTQNGRDYFHYVTNSPIGQGYAIFSADYALRRSRAGDVALEVFHNPRYPQNVDRILHSMRASLDQFTRRFGPYPHKILRFVEYPSAGGSLHATYATVWYQELFSLFDPEHEPRRIDLPFAVTAHELGHQFQPWSARVEGSILLSESFAWYAALNVIEQEYGAEHLQRLLGFMRESYLRLRPAADVPLLRASDSFQGYRKGPFAMYALQEYVGREKVDLALRRLIERSRAPQPPFVTSLDLVQELRKVTPDSLQELIGDLIERNTFWQLETQGATARHNPGGDWLVSLEVKARKVAVDTAGTETELPMNDLVEIGVFAPADSGAAQGTALHLSKHLIRTGLQTITITVPTQPARAGIDPRHLLIDVDPDNNIKDVTTRDQQ